MIYTITDILRGGSYNGFKFHNVIRICDRDSYQFYFINEDKYFQIEIVHQAIIDMTPSQIVSYIDRMVRSHPDLQKASHHQEFYKKFDEILK